MSVPESWQFVLEHVPSRCDHESAIIECAALRCGLRVKRRSRSTVTVDIRGDTVPFNGLHGPDTSYMAKQLGRNRAAQRALAEYYRVPMVSSDDTTSERISVFVIDGNCISAVKVARACIVGDGGRSVGELIREKNKVRGGHPYVRNDPVPEELSALDELVASGRDLGFVPAQGEHVVLRSAAQKGAELVDVRDTVDGGVLDLAVDAVRLIPGLPYAGVEIIVPSNSMDAQVRKVLCPASAAVQFPTSGKARDVAGGIIEHYVRSPRWQRGRWGEG